MYSIRVQIKIIIKIWLKRSFEFEIVYCYLQGKSLYIIKSFLI